VRSPETAAPELERAIGRACESQHEAEWVLLGRSREPADCAQAQEQRDTTSYSSTSGLTQTPFLESSPTFLGH